MFEVVAGITLIYDDKTGKVTFLTKEDEERWERHCERVRLFEIKRQREMEELIENHRKYLQELRASGQKKDGLF